MRLGLARKFVKADPILMRTDTVEIQSGPGRVIGGQTQTPTIFNNALFRPPVSGMKTKHTL
jgi:hypothetical protein